MEKLMVNKSLEILESEAECIQNYEEYCKAMDMMYELKKIFKVEED